MQFHTVYPLLRVGKYVHLYFGKFLLLRKWKRKHSQFVQYCVSSIKPYLWLPDNRHPSAVLQNYHM